ncbi:TIGR02466 family protein [Blastomonas sp.]|uniref:TIGR02466 family protein n=1 Tax=Blastomonas sp. TaxID=1909299 RepID=UPI003593675C
MADVPPSDGRAEVTGLFATPLIRHRMPNAAALNAALAQAICERRSGDTGIQRSNAGGWHSDTRLFEWAGEASHELARAVITLADAHTQDVRAEALGRRGWLLEGWANINGQGAANVQHSHGATYWAAVYFVQAEADGGGRLRLHDPRLPALDMHAPDLRFADCQPEQLHEIVPEPGLLVMFPGWLGHSVTSWHGESERISIAINLTARPRQPAR